MWGSFPFCGGIFRYFLDFKQKGGGKVDFADWHLLPRYRCQRQNEFPNQTARIARQLVLCDERSGCTLFGSYPAEEWERLSQKVAAIPESKGAQLKRWLFSGACEMVPDQQGRILIPQDLRQFAGLEKDVVVIGANNKAEIWNRAGWEIANAAVDLDEMMSVLDTLGF